MKLAGMTCLVLALSGSLALAVEAPSPPAHGNAKQQKKWLREHLAADMRTINAFPEKAYGSVALMVNSASSHETDLLADCYQLTRKIAEEELRQIAQAQAAQAQIAQAQAAQAQAAQPGVAQPPAVAPAEYEQSKADREDLRELYRRLAAARTPVRMVGQYIYASLPGWCAQAAQFIPPSYYGNGQYVGPLDSDEYAGPYAGYVCRAYAVRRVGDQAAHRGTNHNRVVTQDSGSGQNGVVPRGTNPHPVVPRAATAPTWGNGTYQRGAFQGLAATPSSRGR